MKVLTCITPGLLEYTQRPEPVLTSGCAILRIKKVGVCGTDLHAYEGTQPFFNYPRTLGHELAAELVDFDNAPGFRKGEQVTIVPYFYCGKCIACRTGKPNCCASLQVSGVHIDGGFCEYLSVPSYSLIHGEGLNSDTLALAEPLAIGGHAVRRGAVTRGEFVLVLGAGPIGLAVMEFAQRAGGQVIAVDVRENRLRFCSDHIKPTLTINASHPNVMEILREITGGDMANVIFDATGNRNAITNAFQYLAHGGRFVLVGLQKEEISFSHPEFHKREATLMSSRNATREDFIDVISCLKTGTIDASSYITHRVMFGKVGDHFREWIDPRSDVIKAMISVNE